MEILTIVWQFVLSQLVPLSFAVGAWCVLEGTKLFIVRSENIRKENKIDPNADDILMIDAAIEKDSDRDRIQYFRGWVLRELRTLTETYTRSKKFTFYLGFAALLGSSFSSLITGGNLTFLGLTSLQFSFIVTSIGAFASVLLIFGSWEKRAVDAQLLARLIRLETWQWISGSQEYYKIPPDEAWKTYTLNVETLLLNSFKADADATKKVEKGDKDAIDETEEKNDDAPRAPRAPLAPPDKD